MGMVRRIWRSGDGSNEKVKVRGCGSSEGYIIRLLGDEEKVRWSGENEGYSGRLYS